MVSEENLRQRVVKEEKLKKEAQKIAESLKENTVKVATKAGENGKIFGSVNTIQLAEAIESMGFTVNRKYIKIKGEPIKSVGSYEADIRLHREVSVSVKFDVVAE